MSHTSQITSVIITDEIALKSAIQELKENGVKCDLLENAVPRSYYGSRQEGMNQAARYVVYLPTSKYDVGLYPSDKGKGFTARTDFYSGQVESVLGAAVGEGDDYEQARLGKLYQMYAVHAATRRAVQQGYRVSRLTKSDGTIQLRVATA